MCGACSLEDCRRSSAGRAFSEAPSSFVVVCVGFCVFVAQTAGQTDRFGADATQHTILERNRDIFDSG